MADPNVVHSLQEVLQRVGGPRVAETELRQDIAVLDLQAERLGEDRQLLADVSVANDAEGLATNFVAALRNLRNATTTRRLVYTTPLFTKRFSI